MYKFSRCISCYWAFKNNQEHELVAVCPHCTGDMKRLDGEVSIHSNAEQYYCDGNTGFYSMALGRAVENEGEEEKILNAMGFVKESKLNRKRNDDNFVDNWLKAEMEREREAQRLIKIYKDALADGVPEEEAIALAFSAEDALSGKLEEIFK